ncbi:MAG TPA: threonine--tRNA ligase, partial [Candidatus Paceibacterota bacterium]|nr:threonine--tRNA ligase [Candidatus Paceibacterota bacterium]
MKKQPNKINQIRHSLSHLLAMAVLEKFPKAQLGIGPVIENGFYYDFLLPRPIEESELGEIEKIMKGLVRQNIVFKKKEVSFNEAEKLFKSRKQPFKVELVRDLKKFGTT